MPIVSTGWTAAAAVAAAAVVGCVAATTRCCFVVLHCRNEACPLLNLWPCPPLILCSCCNTMRQGIVFKVRRCGSCQLRVPLMQYCRRRPHSPAVAAAATGSLRLPFPPSLSPLLTAAARCLLLLPAGGCGPQVPLLPRLRGRIHRHERVRRSACLPLLFLPSPQADRVFSACQHVPACLWCRFGVAVRCKARLALLHHILTLPTFPPRASQRHP